LFSFPNLPNEIHSQEGLINSLEEQKCPEKLSGLCLSGYFRGGQSLYLAEIKGKKVYDCGMSGLSEPRRKYFEWQEGIKVTAFAQFRYLYLL
jgi:hypothetical protein